MIEVLPSSAHLVVIRASGKVDKKQWQAATSTVRDALSQHEFLAVYVDLSELETFSAGAVLEDAEFAVKNLGSLDKFTRVAVVADEGWLATATEFGEKLIPDLDTEVFRPDQEAEAFRWVSAAPE